jgi:hypothetical protein
MNSNFKKNALILLLLLPACAQVQTGTVDKALQPLAPGIVVVSEPVGKGYYAVVANVDGRWKVVRELSTERIYRRALHNQEILFVNRSLRSVAPSFNPRTMNSANSGESAECTPYLQNNKIYGLCYSYFGKTDTDTSLLRNIFACATTLCLGVGTTEILDHEKVQEVVLESGLIEMVKKRVSDEDHAEYTSTHGATKSSDVGQFKKVSNSETNDSGSIALTAIERIEMEKEYEAMYANIKQILDSAKQLSPQERQNVEKQLSSQRRQ